VEEAVRALTGTNAGAGTGAGTGAAPSAASVVRSSAACRTGYVGGFAVGSDAWPLLGRRAGFVCGRGLLARSVVSVVSVVFVVSVVPIVATDHVEGNFFGAQVFDELKSLQVQIVPIAFSCAHSLLESRRGHRAQAHLAHADTARADVARADEVGKVQTAALVMLGHGDDKTDVAEDQLFQGFLITGAYALGETHLLLDGEAR
jgi:hypothetical protein